MAEQTDGNKSNDDQNAGDLRNQLQQALDANKEMMAKISSYEQDEQLREAGLGHLSKRQRRTILRELQEEGTDFDAEAAKEVAKELGFALESKPPPTTTDTSTSNGDQGQQGDGSQGNGEGSSELQDNALSALAVMEMARRNALTAQGSDDFSGEMKKARNKDELRDTIRTKGPRHGIVHEWDVP